jgi:hypothetical protein
VGKFGCGLKGRTIKNMNAKMRPASPTKPAAIPPTTTDVLVPPVVAGAELGVAEVAMLLVVGVMSDSVNVEGILVVGRSTGAMDCNNGFQCQLRPPGNEYTRTVMLLVLKVLGVEEEIVGAEVEVLVGVFVVVGVAEEEVVEEEVLVVTGVVELAVVAG